MTGVVKTLPSASVWLEADDHRIRQLRLKGGCPVTWHQQRLDAVVCTPQGLVYYGAVRDALSSAGAPPRIGAISAHSMLNLNALGTRPLGLASYGSLVCTLSNPAVVVDFSQPGKDVIFPLMDVAGVSMINAMRIVHVEAVRRPHSAPMDHILFMFCTNDGVLAAKVFPNVPLQRYIAALREDNAKPQSVKQPDAQLMVLQQSDVPINDMHVLLMHPDRNVLAVVLCYDGEFIDVARIRMTSSGTRLKASTVILQRIHTGSLAPVNCPLRGMKGYCTYLAAAGKFVVATADTDSLVVVLKGALATMMEAESASTLDRPFELVHVIHTVERPYKAVHVAGDCFLVGCQRVVLCIDAANGCVVSFPLPDDVVGTICGLVSLGDGIAYVAVMQQSMNAEASPKRFLRVNVAGRPRITLDGTSDDLTCFDREGNLIAPRLNDEDAALTDDNFSLRSLTSQWLRPVHLEHVQRDSFVACGIHRCRQGHVLVERWGGTSPVGTEDEKIGFPMNCHDCKEDQQRNLYFWCGVCGEVLCVVCATEPPEIFPLPEL